LVVDDDPGVRRLIARVLEQDHHEVTAAENGREAIQWLKKKTFDLVITDWMMPETGGAWLLEQIAQADFRLPVITVSSRSDVALDFKPHWASFVKREVLVH